jgi:hypothetical protein
MTHMSLSYYIQCRPTFHRLPRFYLQPANVPALHPFALSVSPLPQEFPLRPVFSPFLPPALGGSLGPAKLLLPFHSVQGHSCSPPLSLLRSYFSLLCRCPFLFLHSILSLSSGVNASRLAAALARLLSFCSGVRLLAFSPHLASNILEVELSPQG